MDVTVPATNAVIKDHHQGYGHNYGIDTKDAIREEGRWLGAQSERLGTKSSQEAAEITEAVVGQGQRATDASDAAGKFAAAAAQEAEEAASAAGEKAVEASRYFGDKAAHAGSHAAEVAERAGDKAVGSSVRVGDHLSSQFRELQEKLCRLELETAKQACDSREWVTTEVREAVEATSEGFSALTRDTINGFKDARLDAAVFAKDSALAASTNTASILMDSTKNAAALNLAIQVSNAAILVDSTKNAAASTLLAVQNQAASQMTACQNQAAVLAAIAACCCEQKMLTIATGQKTDELLNTRAREEDARRLVAMQNEITLLKIKMPNGVVV